MTEFVMLTQSGTNIFLATQPRSEPNGWAPASPKMY